MDLTEFLEIMKTIPKPEFIDKLCKYNENLIYFEKLATIGYFKLLSPIQIYHLFTTACGHESIDIATLLYSNGIDKDAVKEFMINFLAEVGESNEYVIFRWIWEKNDINFSNEELENCFIKILKTNNLEFADWFYSLNLLNINNENIKNKLANEILNIANDYQTYLTAKWICKKYASQHINII